jgi:hypothetical protein
VDGRHPAPADDRPQPVSATEERLGAAASGGLP